MLVKLLPVLLLYYAHMHVCMHALHFLPPKGIGALIVSKVNRLSSKKIEAISLESSRQAKKERREEREREREIAFCFFGVMIKAPNEEEKNGRRKKN